MGGRGPTFEWSVLRAVLTELNIKEDTTLELVGEALPHNARFGLLRLNGLEVSETTLARVLALEDVGLEVVETSGVGSVDGARRAERGAEEDQPSLPGT